jgi:single-stranded-DNA-specific exonuclease
MQARWTITPTPPASAINWLQQTLLHPALGNYAWQLGLRTPEAVDDYIHPRLDAFHNPWLMKDMHVAVDRIEQAIQSNEKILVYGDYDADGVMAVSCMHAYLSQFITSTHIRYYIPDRQSEGYGITEKGIEFARALDIKLLLVLDCGTNAADRIDQALRMGIETIVCDHHEPRQKLPPAVAILNPKQPDCRYPNKDLCAAGVVQKLICALEEKRTGSPADPLQYLDFVAIATAADIVQLRGENRNMLYWGLQQLNRRNIVGLSALMNLAGLTEKINLQQIIFQLAPKINAAGRMADAKMAIELLLTKDPSIAQTLAQELILQNEKRKLEDAKVSQEAIDQIQLDEGFHHKHTILVYRPDWHVGVIGIVATRLAEKYRKPSIVLTSMGSQLIGSARSVHGHCICDALESCRPFLVSFGGHQAAAGLSLDSTRLAEFSQHFESFFAQSLQTPVLQRMITIVGEVKLRDITSEFCYQLKQFEPFGPGCERPVFLATQVQVGSQTCLLKNQQIRFELEQSGHRILAYGKGMSHQLTELQPLPKIDIVFTVHEHLKMGKKQRQIQVLDFRLSDLASESK